MLELVLAAGLRRSVIVREDEAALADEGEEPFEASNSAVAMQEPARHRPAIRKREITVRQGAWIDRAVVVFGSEQTIDLQKFAAGGRVRRFGPLVKHGQGQVGVVGQAHVTSHAGAR